MAASGTSIERFRLWHPIMRTFDHVAPASAENVNPRFRWMPPVGSLGSDTRTGPGAISVVKVPSGFAHVWLV